MSKEDDEGKQGCKTQLLENQLVAIVKCKRELEEETGAEYVSDGHWKTHICSQGHTMCLPRARAAWIQKELVPASPRPDPPPVPTTHSLNCPCPSCAGLRDSPSLPRCARSLPSHGDRAFFTTEAKNRLWPSTHGQGQH